MLGTVTCISKVKSIKNANNIYPMYLQLTGCLLWLLEWMAGGDSFWILTFGSKLFCITTSSQCQVCCIFPSA